jgi:transcription elongation factor GreA
MTNTMLTREGYDKLVAELNYLRNVKRAEVSERLRNAIDCGRYLLENAIHAARMNIHS